MLSKAAEWLSRLSLRQALWAGVLLALAIEALTCLLRFAAHMTAAESTGWMAAFTFGWRIHHGYIGVLLFTAGLFCRAGRLGRGLMIVGAGLALADLLHHFAVLWPLTGSPEFHLRYPE
ncbi:MAG: hypothetical protein GXY85_10390 [Candidatus Brocadiaceae bacterium]|nr:hypothetical protein [Candidatus Brocadiaceae bacterium]